MERLDRVLFWSLVWLLANHWDPMWSVASSGCEGEIPSSVCSGCIFPSSLLIFVFLQRLIKFFDYQKKKTLYLVRDEKLRFTTNSFEIRQTPKGHSLQLREHNIIVDHFFLSLSLSPANENLFR